MRYFGARYFQSRYFTMRLFHGISGAAKTFGVTIYRGLSKAVGVIEAEGVTIIRSIIDNE